MLSVGSTALTSKQKQIKPVMKKYQFPVIEASINNGVAPLKRAYNTEKAPETIS